jgi:DNA-directed RNA polymerase specialized sigma24 family protein
MSAHDLGSLDRHREMTTADPLLLELASSRERFLDVVAGIRPELHRFCARMTGSVADGEDIVQETLTRAYASLSQLEKVAQLRSWLLRIAHNQAIDHVRGYEHRMRDPLDVSPVLRGVPPHAAMGGAHRGVAGLREDLPGALAMRPSASRWRRYGSASQYGRSGSRCRLTQRRC